MGWLRVVGSLKLWSLFQNIVSFIRHLCKRDLYFKEPTNRSHPIPTHTQTKTQTLSLPVSLPLSRAHTRKPPGDSGAGIRLLAHLTCAAKVTDLDAPITHQQQIPSTQVTVYKPAPPLLVSLDSSKVSHVARCVTCS